MKKFYFTFGTCEHFLFQGGWIVIEAPSLKAAARIFKEYYPNPKDEETLNCSDYYTEEQFKETGMADGNRGACCHLIIGPHAQDIGEMVKDLKEAIPLHDGNKFEQGYHAALEDIESYGRPVDHVTV